MLIDESLSIDGSLILKNDELVLNRETQDITIEYSKDDGNSWWLVDYVRADLSGDFNLTWTPQASGQYIIRAVFSGNEYYTSNINFSEPILVGTIVDVDDSWVMSDELSVPPLRLFPVLHLLQ